jgi:hypothetical protein
MRKAWTPSIVPRRGDETIYIVENDFDRAGRAFVETESDTADLETAISDLAGQHSNPIRVISFNTAEHWSEDVSEDIAREIRRRFDVQGQDVPSHIQDFVEKYDGRTQQFALRLA